jgi:hypothetical protein
VSKEREDTVPNTHTELVRRLVSDTDTPSAVPPDVSKDAANGQSHVYPIDVQSVNVFAEAATTKPTN